MLNGTKYQELLAVRQLWDLHIHITFSQLDHELETIL